MTASRWHLHRAGMLNFWFYDEAEFRMEGGRLILRGANGSGKSVTMQSFLPLVLDGDKRSSRLDPFGSRDRKIEYYLLGEGASARNECTAYLYLEFIDPSANKYLTVGIGLKAKHGAQQVGFWGFSITDQRRIGHDFFLYDRDLWDSPDQKVPLDRAGLEAAIDSGGKVVREQGEYRNMVNQLLFGFEDPEAYKEFLNLLIQLRSPKLSKDHKPSVIYEILNDAMPALSDEDLRPLSEVLEDLDEISDRLEELAQHRADLESLAGIYDQYNRMRLYLLSSQVVQHYADVQERDRETRAQRTAHDELQRRIDRIGTRILQVRQAVLEAEAKIDAIDRSKAMEMQRDFENASVRLEEVKREIRGIVGRKEEHIRELGAKRERLAQAEAEHKQHEVEAGGYRTKLDGLAVGAELADHTVYTELWKDPEARLAPRTWESLQQDIKRQEGALKQARELGLRERRQKERADAAEKVVSDAREARDQKDRRHKERQRELEDVLTVQENAVLAWRDSLRELPVEDAQWRESLRRLQRYPEAAYADVVSPIRDALSAANSAVESRRAEARQQKRMLEEERAARGRELAEWQNQREPEPSRSRARAETRKRRLEQAAGKTAGGPLYTLCEFHPWVDEPTQAAIETALHQAGVLDAWVGMDGWNPDSAGGDEPSGDEEAWIRPSPLLFGETLAEYLKPAPSKESGLTPVQVDDVLRTIVMTDWTADDATTVAADARMRVTVGGRFQLGPLAGMSAVKPQAEWIGVEARRRTRLAQMERLQAEIADLEAQMAELAAVLGRLDEQQRQMAAEFAAFPEEKPLRAASDALHNARLDLQNALGTEERATESFKEALRQWRELQRQFLDSVSRWQRIQSVEHLEEGIDRLHEYQLTCRDLKSAYAAQAKASLDIRTLTAELAALDGKVRQEESALHGASERRASLQAEVDALRQLLTESGAMELVAQLAALKMEREAGKKEDTGLNEEMHGLREDRGRIETTLEAAKRAQTDVQARLETASDLLREEWRLGFVDPPEGVQSSDAVKLAQAYVRLERSRLESRQMHAIDSRLMDVFSVTSNGLREYALEQTYDEARQRRFIQSLRDRARPVSPAALLRQLRQMEEEQRALISEKDRELYEQILLHSVGRAIRDRINRAEQWVDQMNRFMAARKTSSGLALSLAWTPKPAQSEAELNADELVALLRRSPETLRENEIDRMMGHFRSRIDWAKELTGDGATLRQGITSLLDYRTWFRFTLYFKKGESPKRELTDSRFNVLSGGEKAMAMYIPLFAAVDSRYKDSRPTAPRIVSLDEAFAGVDEQNMRDMFQLLTDMEFDYMMTSQVLWGCYESVPELSIYEVHRPNDAAFVTLIPYYWNGITRSLVVDDDWQAVREIAAASQS